MADAIIELVGPEDLPVITQLYNQIFRPARDLESFQRRFLGRYNILQLVARLSDRPVGFFIGFELKPTVYFAWFYGVPLHATGMATIAFAAVFLSFAVPGIPRGAFIMLTPLFLAIGLPAEGIGILIAASREGLASGLSPTMHAARACRSLTGLLEANR